MEKGVIKRKLLASLLIVMLLANILTPYGSLLFAKTPAEKPDEPCVLFRRSSDIQGTGNKKYFTVDVVITSYDKECFYTNIDINLKYDASKIKLCRRSGNTTTKFTEATSISQAMAVGDGAYETNYGDTMTYLDTTNNWFRLYLTNIAPESPNWYDGEMTIATLYFRLEDDTITDDNIGTIPFFSPRTTNLTTGSGYIEIDYGPDATIVTDPAEFLDSIVYDVNSKYLGMEGLAPIEEDEPAVKSIAVKTNPTKTTYTHGDSIDLTGGVITVTYEDNSTKDVDMKDPKVSIKRRRFSRCTITTSNDNIRRKRRKFSNYRK